MPRLKYLKPKTVNGSSALTAEGKDQLEELFGVRYHVIASNGPENPSRAQRRRARYGGRGG